MEPANCIYLEITKKNKIIENYLYQIDTNELDYFEASQEKLWSLSNDELKCYIDNCESSKEKIDYFLNELEEILQ